MPSKVVSNPMNKRAMISFFVALSFLIMVFTGLILIIVPQGKVAYWTDWHLLWLSKTQWADVHTLSSFLFMTAGIFHIYFNWKSLMNYLFEKMKYQLRLKKELSVALTVSLAIVVIAINRIPPISYIFTFQEYMQESWVETADYDPPMGHAEILPLKSFASKQKMNLDEVQKVLKDNKIIFDSVNESLLSIANKNNTSPMGIYLFIKHLQEEVVTDPGAIITVQMIDDLSGTGLGHKTISVLCDQFKVSVNDAFNRLRKHKLIFSPDDTMKEIGNKNNLHPEEVVKIVLIEGYQGAPL